MASRSRNACATLGTVFPTFVCQEGVWLPLRLLVHCYRRTSAPAVHCRSSAPTCSFCSARGAEAPWAPARWSHAPWVLGLRAATAGQSRGGHTEGGAFTLAALEPVRAADRQAVPCGVVGQGLDTRASAAASLALKRSGRARDRALAAHPSACRRACELAGRGAALPLVLQPTEEAFASCVVRSACLARHRAGEVHIAHSLWPTKPAVVAAPIGVDHGSLSRFGHHLDGCIQHRVDRLGVRAGSNGPADDHFIETVDDGREVHLASRNLELRDVREPFLVGDRGLEAWKSRLMRFSGTGLISPRYDAHQRFLGFKTTRHSCLINRCTTFSEIVTSCLVSEACCLRRPPPSPADSRDGPPSKSSKTLRSDFPFRPDDTDALHAFRDIHFWMR